MSATVYAYDQEETYYIVDHLIDDDFVWDNVFSQKIAEVYLSEKRPDGARKWNTTPGNTNSQILILTLLAGRLLEATFEVTRAANIPAADRR